MASFGLRRPRFAPIKTETDTALPTYGTPVTIGRSIKADLSVNFASGKLFADDALAENVEEFSSGALAMETDDITDEVAEMIYGATVVNGLVDYKAGDSPPPGGVCYYKVLKRQGKTLYKGYYYPRAQAKIGNDSAQTKGDNITFGTSSTAFTIFQANTGTWRQTEEFTDEKKVVEWCDKKLGVTGTPTDPEDPEE